MDGIYFRYQDGQVRPFSLLSVVGSGECQERYHVVFRRETFRVVGSLVSA